MAAVASHLADTSALARLRHRAVAAVLGPLIEAGLVATCGVIECELGWATSSSAEFDELRTEGRIIHGQLGLRGDTQWTPAGELSRGERRRLQLLTILVGEPNVLFLDEPTNDLDVDTLTELGDLLDGWPGSLVVVSHDRYFLERVTDHVVALLGDGKLSFLGGGVEEYLQRRARQAETAHGPGGGSQVGANSRARPALRVSHRASGGAALGGRAAPPARNCSGWNANSPGSATAKLA
jgi:ABC-type polar amino acid transport system ATPase subunit